uniref:Uncharacterized protein n=1 Tax=Oryza rufipogon TaxID=4529 RepID=A0A0E0P7M0_ORYRU
MSARRNAQDTGDVDRFGPLRSVIPYSCVLVDLKTKSTRARALESEREFRLSDPVASLRPPLPFLPLFLGLGLLFFYLVRGHHTGLSLPKKRNMLFTMRANPQPEMTTDKQYTRLLLRSSALPVDARFNLHSIASD